MTQHIFTINTITKAGRVLILEETGAKRFQQYSCCARFGKTPSNQSTHQSGCKKQRRSLSTILQPNGGEFILRERFSTSSFKV